MYKRNEKGDRISPCIVPLSTGIWSVSPPWGRRTWVMAFWLRLFIGVGV